MQTYLWVKSIDRKLELSIDSIKCIDNAGLIKSEFVITADNVKDPRQQKNYTFMFLSVFNAPKHLKFLESHLREKKVYFVGRKKTLTGIEEKKIENGGDEIKDSAVEINEEEPPIIFTNIKNVRLKNMASLELSVTSTKLFDMFYSGNADHPFIAFLKKEGEEDIVCSGWEINGSETSRTITFVTKISGIPSALKSFSGDKCGVIRVENLIKNSTSFGILVVIQMPEMTYGNRFELFNLFVAKDMENGKCVLDAKYAIHYKKSIPFLQNKISNNSLLKGVHGK